MTALDAILAACIVAMSLLCFALYAIDKSAALAGRRRVPERRLLLLGLLGGWPGGLLAQQLLRHKTRKTSFLLPFWLTVLINVIVVVALHSTLLVS